VVITGFCWTGFFGVGFCRGILVIDGLQCMSNAKSQHLPFHHVTNVINILPCTVPPVFCLSYNAFPAIVQWLSTLRSTSSNIYEMARVLHLLCRHQQQRLYRQWSACPWLILITLRRRHLQPSTTSTTVSNRANCCRRGPSEKYYITGCTATIECCRKVA